MVPVVANQTLTTADTEYSVTLPGRCRGFMLQCRTEVPVRLSFVTGKVATPTAPYATIKAGGAYDLTANPGQAFEDLTIYLASSMAGAIAEIIYWS